MKVLFIAYYFDPFPGVGAKRVSYWAKNIYKSSSGTIIPTVITATKQIDETDLEIIYVEDRDKSFFKRLFPKDKGITWLNDIKKYFITNDFYYDIVLITGSPFLHFSLSQFFKERKSKVILDFRDPFAINPLFQNQHLIKVMVKKYLEKRFIDHADSVITVNHYCSDLLQVADKSKISIIDNGYDEQNLININPIKYNDDMFHIVYAGKLSHGRDILPFLTYINENNKIIFHYVGPDSELIPSDYNNIIIHGVKPYTDTMQIIANADAGLVLSGGHDFESTTKVFDYIGLKKSIIIITEGKIKTGNLYEITKYYQNTFWFENTLESFQNITSHNFEEKCIFDTSKYARKYGLKKLIGIMKKL